METSSAQLFRQYLSVTDDGDAERTLAQILDEVATPLVRRVVASAIHDGDAEDVVADTLVDLLRRLRDVRGDAAQPIRDLRRYIVTCAYNRCHERLRERYPARTRLRNQLRYLCSRDRELASWSANGEVVCGFREWAGREAVASDRLEDVRFDVTHMQMAALVPALLRHAGGPLTLDVLSSVIARMTGIDDERAGVPLAELECTTEMRVDELLEQRRSLRRLWNDVRTLTLRQRIALLLNLRDVHFLPLTRTATVAEIADAVGMDADAFASLWKRLPLADAAIGELLHATPRQVIKLRRLARERLQRIRARSWFPR